MAMGFFGPVEVPPRTISVEVSFGETRQVQWSGFKVPQIDGELRCETYPDGLMLYFAIKGEVKRKHLDIVKRVADLARQKARTNSIYKGKAITLPLDSDGDVNWLGFRHIDLRNAGKEKLIFSDTVKAQIQANLFTPIEKSDVCRANGVPLKRGVLLAGPYGTGKTETAFAAAKVAYENGWTFIMVPKVAALKAAIEIARHFAPSVVFAEDIDRTMSGEERTVSIDDILNCVDGVEGKRDEILLVLTSNHVERINKAMLRPGRIDALIEVTPPDAKAVRDLIRMYCGQSLAQDEKLEESSRLLAGKIPAIIAEVCRKAKLYAIARDPSNIIITDADLSIAAVAMEPHFRLMAGAPEDTSTPHSRLGKAVETVLVSGVDDLLVKQFGLPKRGPEAKAN
jgi:transitional endoplasmic reticulum ATPase